MQKNIETVQKEIGNLIKYIRLLHNISTNELAEIINCTEEKFEKLESAQDPISAAEIFLLSKGLMIPVEKFFPESSDEENLPEEELDQISYSILKIFSEIENPQTRKQILGMCRLYNELEQNPLLKQT